MHSIISHAKVISQVMFVIITKETLNFMKNYIDVRFINTNIVSFMAHDGMTLVGVKIVHSFISRAKVISQVMKVSSYEFGT